MKANELMIGDWVNVAEFGILDQVLNLTPETAITGHGDTCGEYEYERLEPVPLTPEIIAKFQDLKMPRKFGAYVKKLNFYNLGSSLQIVEANEVTILHMRVRYVHELQHALRLCGITKEVEL